jgi:hypothetical protein
MDGSTINDGDAADLTGAIPDGTILIFNHVVTVGSNSYVVNVQADTTSIQPPSLRQGIQDTTVSVRQTAGSVAGAVHVIVSWNPGPSSPTAAPLFFETQIVQDANSFGSATLDSTAGPNNAVTSLSVSGAGSSDSDVVAFNPSNTPYFITQDFGITLAGLNQTFGASASGTITAVPAPAGLILAATALPFVGLLRRRLRKPEATTAA